MKFNTRDYGMVICEKKRYGDGNIALTLTGDTGSKYPGEAIATLTTNLDETMDLDDGEFHVKIVEGLKSIAEDAIASGLFVDTGKRQDAGRVANYAAVWRFADAKEATA